MKRRETIQKFTIPFCRAYREELQEIIDLMTIAGALPKLVSGEYEFDETDEFFRYLGESGKSEIEISRSRPSITFRSFGYSSATLEMYAADDSSIALFHRISDVLKHCERPTPFRYRSWPAGVAAGVMGLGFINTASHLHSWLSVPYGVLFAIGLAVFVWVFTNPHKGATAFYGVSRGAQKSFWQRKRDDILVAVIAAFLGGILGVVGTLLTQTLTSKT